MGEKIKIGSDKHVVFWCPGCGFAHRVPVKPDPRGWEYNGDVEKPTLSPSVLVRWTNEDKQQVCHSFVRDGKIQFLSDCTHNLAGKTIDVPDWNPESDNYVG